MLSFKRSLTSGHAKHGIMTPATPPGRGLSYRADRPWHAQDFPHASYIAIRDPHSKQGERQ